MGANVLVPIALLAFVPIALVCVKSLGPRRGVLASLVGGWLFLPTFDGVYDVPLIHSKGAFVPVVVLLASFLLDGRRWFGFRARLSDAPMAVLCLVPFASSLSNGLGAYDGAASTLNATLCWGVPYFLGRLYFRDPGALGELAAVIVAGALSYAPLCLWEIRMSPQLHRNVYGFHAAFFGQAVRFGGFRPTVFMTHGLMVGMFMATSTLVAIWLWRTRSHRKVARVPIAWVCLLLTVTTVLCKSSGAIILLALGVLVLEGTRWLRTSALVVALVVVPAAYCVARLSGWSGEGLVAMAEQATGAERAESLGFRMYNEDKLIAKALDRPWLGWGGWGRSRVYDEEGRDLTITDGLWIITLGTTGLVGLLALALSLALPALLLLRLVPPRRWREPWLAPAAGLTVVLLLWAVDEVLNAMPTPLYPAMAGALLSLAAVGRGARSRSTHPPAREAPRASVARG
jgi:hypothetical protein